MRKFALIMLLLFASLNAESTSPATSLDLTYEYGTDHGTGRKYTEDQLVQILKSFPDLRALNISGQILNPTTGSLINGHMPRLQKLIMAGYIRFIWNDDRTHTRDVLQTIDLDEGFLTALFKGGFPSLQTLVIDFSTVDDKGLSIIADGAPHLKEISLVGVDKITDAGLKYLLQKAPGIKTIYLGPIILMEAKGPHKKVEQHISKEMIKTIESQGIEVVIISRLV